MPAPIDAQLSLLGTDIPVYRLLVIVAAIAVYIAIWLFLNRTITGKAIRAGIESVEHVEGLAHGAVASLIRAHPVLSHPAVDRIEDRPHSFQYSRLSFK